VRRCKLPPLFVGAQLSVEPKWCSRQGCSSRSLFSLDGASPYFLASDPF